MNNIFWIIIILFLIIYKWNIIKNYFDLSPSSSSSSSPSSSSSSSPSSSISDNNKIETIEDINTINYSSKVIDEIRENHKNVSYIITKPDSGFYNTYPARVGDYPNSYVEINDTKEAKKWLHDPNMLMIYYKSDKNIFQLFFEYMKRNNLPYDEDTVKEFLSTYNKKIWELKKKYNRPRPVQLDPSLDTLPAKNIIHPSYPSGHSTQGFLLARYISIYYPHHRDELMTIADKIGKSRIAAGHHFPSDHQYGKKLALHEFNVIPKNPNMP